MLMEAARAMAEEGKKPPTSVRAGAAAAEKSSPSAATRATAAPSAAESAQGELAQREQAEANASRSFFSNPFKRKSKDGAQEDLKPDNSPKPK